MPVRKSNLLWPFTSRKTGHKAKPARSSMTVAQATRKAFEAGKESGDTGLFNDWAQAQGLAGRGNVLKARLRKEYERGFESNFGPAPGTSKADERNREFLKRQEAKETTHKGRRIEATSDGQFTVPSLDRESHFDTVADAKKFIDHWKANPKKKGPTDRALRYRANQTPPEGPKQCAFCGSKETIEIGHVDGHEEHGEIEYLVWTCRSCNVIAANTLRKANMGRKTRQYNPTKSGGAANVGEWMQAVGAITPHGYPRGTGRDRGIQSSMKTMDAVAMIRATPASKRSEYARQLARYRTSRSSAADERWNPRDEAYYAAHPEKDWYGRKKTKRNPQDAAEALYESFHGVPSTETILVEETVHEHEHLATLGTLTEMVVETATGLLATITFDETDTPWLCSSEDGKQLYIEGGDQELDLAAFKMDGEEWLKDRMVIGQFAEPEPASKGRNRRKHNLTYRTEKKFDHFEEVDYQHDLGEETGVRPMLVYAPRDKHLYIEGGQYRIEMPLFDMSPGIEN